MSQIDDIWEAYHKGQEAADNEDVLEMFVHYGIGDVMRAMLPDPTDDEEIAFEKGYGGEELEVCEECESVIENCECENNDEEDEE